MSRDRTSDILISIVEWKWDESSLSTLDSSRSYRKKLFFAFGKKENCELFREEKNFPYPHSVVRKIILRCHKIAPLARLSNLQLFAVVCVVESMSFPLSLFTINVQNIFFGFHQNIDCRSHSRAPGWPSPFVIGSLLVVKLFFIASPIFPAMKLSLHFHSQIVVRCLLCRARLSWVKLVSNCVHREKRILLVFSATLKFSCQTTTRKVFQ